MNKIIFGKYQNNNSFLTKLDARFKLIAMIALIVFCFLNLHIYTYLSLFGLVVIFTIIGKLKFKPLFRIIRHMWFLMLILLLINLFNVTGEVWFNIGKFLVYKEAIIETVYIFLRLVMILLVSNLLTATTTPQELTYAIEFFLTPLKLFKVNVYEISLMMSIALRFIPTLLEEVERIMKAQTSRGVDFKHGGYFKKLRALTSIIVPLFVSCFQRSDELSEAMVIKGYGMGKRSKYQRLHFSYRDIVALIVVSASLVGIAFLNGVFL